MMSKFFKIVTIIAFMFAITWMPMAEAAVVTSNNDLLYSTGLKIYFKAESQGLIESDKIIFVDMSKPSTEDRLYIIDTTTGLVEHQAKVSHGAKSGDLYATKFSNKVDSHKTSIGVYSTGKHYYGKYGKSLKLHGLDKGFNDNAYKRNVVVHYAPYATDKYVEENGRLGKSWGCPSVDKETMNKILDATEEQTILIIYYPDSNWLDNSEWIK
jgi:hypothetical protein